MEHKSGKYEEVSHSERLNIVRSAMAHLLIRLAGADHRHMDAAREIAVRHLEAARQEFYKLITREDDTNDKEDSKNE